MLISNSTAKFAQVFLLECIRGNFRQEKIFANFTICSHWWNFCHTNFLSCVNGYVEDMATCIGENLFHWIFLQYKGSWAWQIFYQAKITVVRYCIQHSTCTVVIWRHHDSLPNCRIMLTKDLSIELHPHQSTFNQATSSKTAVALLATLASLPHLQQWDGVKISDSLTKCDKYVSLTILILLLKA